MLLRRKIYILEPPVRFVLKRAIPLSKYLFTRFEPPARYVGENVVSLGVKAVDRYVPDKLLLLFINTLDKRVPPEAIDIVIDEVDKHVPPKVRSSLIATADEYVPDTAANSRKISTIVAGLGKYVPDSVIPPESLDRWANLKARFHIATLLSRRRRESPRD